MKILIIEDEKDLREVMTRSLEKERFVVETAADYSTALQKINDYDYDCILLDIMLPGGSGRSGTFSARSRSGRRCSRGRCQNS